MLPTVTTYRPKMNILWDTWFYKESYTYHAFYLQASDKITHPDLRHNLSSIGHATSQDLVHFIEQPPALAPSKGAEWDNLALWTGSVYKNGDIFYLFYTGRKNFKQEFWLQKIGVARSKDLTKWEKYKENPILTRDNRYYIGDAWRDPYVFQIPQVKKFYMLITANDASVVSPYNGCVALAESVDLIHWQTHPPLLSPGIYTEMEVCQLIFFQKKYYLFFSTLASKIKPEWREKNKIREGGLHCYISERFESGYSPVNGNGVVMDNGEELYSVQIVGHTSTGVTAIGWLNLDSQKRFVGALSKPFHLKIDEDRVIVE